MKKLFSNQIFSYLFFGVLTTLVYLFCRRFSFDLLGLSATLAAGLANLVAILFAFFTNDRFVFRQKASGWQGRLVKFTAARLSTLALDLLLAELLVQRYPQIIGQFVNHELATVDKIESLFAQVLIIVGNYFISKFLVFNRP